MRSAPLSLVRRLLCAAATVSTACALAVSARAAGFPDKPVTLVVPFASGGSIDAAIRVVQPRLSAELGQPVVIENLGGAGGALGAGRVANAAKDGYTLLVGSINDVVLVPVLNRNVRYEARDFVPIGPISSNSPLLVARKDLPANDLDGVISALRARPESISYGSPGMGTMQHLVMEDLQQRATVRMLHAPYKGAGPLLADLLGGQIDLAVMVPATALPHIRAGRIKVLGVASLQRQPMIKHIPTLNEGKVVKGLEMSGWMGLFAPRGVAPDHIARLKAALEAALASKGVPEQLTGMGMQVATATEQRQFADQIARDEAKARSLSVKLH